VSAAGAATAIPALKIRAVAAIRVRVMGVFIQGSVAQWPNVLQK